MPSPPSCFAAYIAWSARRSSPSAGGPVGGELGDPDRGGHVASAVVEAQGLADRCRGSGRRGGGLFQRGREVAQEHPELVAAEAGHGVTPPGGLVEPGGHEGQHLVAGPVAQLVVDRLEAVEVDPEKGPTGAQVAGAPDLVVEELDQARLVDEAGEVVGEGVVGGPALEAAEVVDQQDHQGQQGAEEEDAGGVPGRSVNGGGSPTFSTALPSESAMTAHSHRVINDPQRTARPANTAKPVAERASTTQSPTSAAVVLEPSGATTVNRLGGHSTTPVTRVAATARVDATGAHVGAPTGAPEVLRVAAT